MPYIDVSHNVELLVRAYLVYVRPLLEYNSPVWSPYLMYDIHGIEHVQRLFTKRLPCFGTYITVMVSTAVVTII